MEAAASTSDESNIEVIACYRQLPVQPQPSVAGRQIATDLSGYADSEVPDFPWNDFESIMGSIEGKVNHLERGAGPSGATRTGSPIIRHC